MKFKIPHNFCFVIWSSSEGSNGKKCAPARNRFFGKAQNDSFFKGFTIRSCDIIKILFFIIVLIVLLQSCNNQPVTKDIETYFQSNSIKLDIKSETEYAKGFDIYVLEDITKVIVRNPRNPEMVISEYYLVPDLETKSKFADNDNIIVVPINRAAVFSGTQLSALIKTDLIDRIVGVSEAEYINNNKIKSLISKGIIKELASNGEFYLETALEVNPDIIFHSPYKLNESHPLAVTNITMVPFLDFMETTPLGRAEWLKFTSAFFGKTEMSDSIFQDIVNEYDKYALMLVNIENKPTVFSDKYFNGQWYVPGGKSYIAKLFKDAGADYLWKSDEGVASFPLDYEVVFQKAVHADFWRIVGSFNDEASYEYLGLENELYSHFDAFKNKKIIWCNAQTSSYFENSPLEPHLVLADLIHCFHPELLPDYEPKYYRLIK